MALNKTIDFGGDLDPTMSFQLFIDGEYLTVDPTASDSTTEAAINGMAVMSGQVATWDTITSQQKWQITLDFDPTDFNVFTDDLLLKYDFDEGTGTTIHDRTNGGNNHTTVSSWTPDIYDACDLTFANPYAIDLTSGGNITIPTTDFPTWFDGMTVFFRFKLNTGSTSCLASWGTGSTRCVQFLYHTFFSGIFIQCSDAGGSGAPVTYGKWVWTPDTNWHTIALRVPAQATFNDLVFYFDGKQETLTQLTSNDNFLFSDCVANTPTIATVADGDGATVSENQTIELTGGSNYGTFTIGTYNGTTGAINYNASAAEMESALNAVLGGGVVTVSRSGSGTSGSPYLYDVLWGDVSNHDEMTVASSGLYHNTPITNFMIGDFYPGPYAPVNAYMDQILFFDNDIGDSAAKGLRNYDTPTSGCVLYLNCDEGTGGTLNDSSSSGNSVSTSITWYSSTIGTPIPSFPDTNAIYMFDGTYQYITFTNNQWFPAFEDEGVTVHCRIKTQAGATLSYPWEFLCGSHLFLANNNFPPYNWYAGNSYSSGYGFVKEEDGKKYVNLTVVVPPGGANNSDILIYYNGGLQTLSLVAGTDGAITSGTVTGVALGVYPASPSSTQGILMDMFQVWRGAKDATFVADLNNYNPPVAIIQNYTPPSVSEGVASLALLLNI